MPSTNMTRTEPSGIPRPPNAFIIYRKARRESIKEAAKQLGISGIRGSDLSKLAGQLWKAEPEDVKIEFFCRAEVAKNEHHAANPGYQYQPRRGAERRPAKKSTRRSQSLTQDALDAIVSVSSSSSWSSSSTSPASSVIPPLSLRTSRPSTSQSTSSSSTSWAQTNEATSRCIPQATSQSISSGFHQTRPSGTSHTFSSADVVGTQEFSHYHHQLLNVDVAPVSSGSRIHHPQSSLFQQGLHRTRSSYVAQPELPQLSNLPPRPRTISAQAYFNAVGMPSMVAPLQVAGKGSHSSLPNGSTIDHTAIPSAQPQSGGVSPFSPSVSEACTRGTSLDTMSALFSKPIPSQYHFSPPHMFGISGYHYDAASGASFNDHPTPLTPQSAPLEALSPVDIPALGIDQSLRATGGSLSNGLWSDPVGSSSLEECDEGPVAHLGEEVAFSFHTVLSESPTPPWPDFDTPYDGTVTNNALPPLPAEIETLWPPGLDALLELASAPMSDWQAI